MSSSNKDNELKMSELESNYNPSSSMLRKRGRTRDKSQEDRDLLDHIPKIADKFESYKKISEEEYKKFLQDHPQLKEISQKQLR